MTVPGKPLKIAGVRIVPKWDWTPAYTAEVRETYGNPPSPKSQKERDAQFMARVEAYARWIGERQGINIPRGTFAELFEGVIIFSEMIEERDEWRITRKAGTEIARIAIPNFGRLEREPDLQTEES